MGNCRSCESRSTTTAKLILVGGELREFAWPVNVSLVLQRDSGCFICSSEEMEFDEFAAAMGGDEVLRPGEIYFELPLAWRKVRLQAEDMAALALKASLALRNSRDVDDDQSSLSCCCCCRQKEAAPAELFCEKEMPLLAGDGGGGGGGAGRGRWRGGGAKGRKFVARLTAIVED